MNVAVLLTRTLLFFKDYENWGSDLKRQPLSFGSYVTANLYWSATTASIESCPVVIWNHPYSYATGYVESYIPNSNTVVRLAKAGFCVLAFDHIGFATRVREGGNSFYARYGADSSLFGRMIKDVHDAVDALVCMTKQGRANATLCGTGSAYDGTYLPFPAAGTPVLDGTRILAAGYSLGGNIALHAAALDKRISGVAAFSAITPMRSDDNSKPSGGIRRLYEFHALIPRLGFFSETPAHIPYDFDELLASMVAPRPTLIFAAEQDRDATFSDVVSCMGRASQAWKEKGSPSSFNFTTASDTYTNMGPDEIEILISWAKQAASLDSVLF